jgi:hypothetical protein
MVASNVHYKELSPEDEIKIFRTEEDSTENTSMHMADGEIMETSGNSDDHSSGSSLRAEDSVILNMPNEQEEHENEEIESESTEDDATNTDDKEESSYTNKHKPGIACLYTNADSLLSKRDLLKHRIN